LAGIEQRGERRQRRGQGDLLTVRKRCRWRERREVGLRPRECTAHADVGRIRGGVIRHDRVVGVVGTVKEHTYQRLVIGGGRGRRSADRGEFNAKGAAVPARLSAEVWRKKV